MDLRNNIKESVAAKIIDYCRTVLSKSDNITGEINHTISETYTNVHIIVNLKRPDYKYRIYFNLDFDKEYKSLDFNSPPNSFDCLILDDNFEANLEREIYALLKDCNLYISSKRRSSSCSALYLSNVFNLSDLDQTSTEIENIGINNKEKQILQDLTSAWNTYIEIEKKSSSLQEFNSAIHRCQQLIALRVARRVNPEIWVQE